MDRLFCCCFFEFCCCWVFSLNQTLIHVEKENSETHIVNVWDFLLSFYYFCLMISQWTILMNSQCVAVARAFKGKGKVIVHVQQIDIRLINQFSLVIGWLFWESFRIYFKLMSCFDTSENALIWKLQLFMLTVCLTHHISICCKNTVFICSSASFCDTSCCSIEVHMLSH